MHKNLFKIVSTFIIIASLFCGCGVNDNGVRANKGKVSEYGEMDMPWGEFNYKKVGVIKELEKNLDKNITTAVFTVDGEDNKVKIYGTDINIDDYDEKEVFITAVENSHIDEDYILVKRYQDIYLENLEVIDSIKKLESLNNNDVNKVINKIDSLKNEDYRNYVIGVYNTKVKELGKIKDKANREKSDYEDSEAFWAEYTKEHNQ